MLQLRCRLGEQPRHTNEDENMSFFDKTDTDKLSDAVNADDDLFMKLDETVRAHAESLGLDPDDFDWDVCFGEKEEEQ